MCVKMITFRKKKIETDSLQNYKTKMFLNLGKARDSDKAAFLVDKESHSTQTLF